MNAQLQRIIVVGSGGSGKTTFSKRLAEVLGHPHVELDVLRWEPHWIKRSAAETSRLLQEAMSHGCWIVDGNKALKCIWLHATAVIWLNYTFPTVFKRILIRTARRLLTRKDSLAEYRRHLRESLGLLLANLRTFNLRRRSIRETRETNPFPHLEWIEFTRPDDAERFLRNLASNLPPGAVAPEP